MTLQKLQSISLFRYNFFMRKRTKDNGNRIILAIVLVTAVIFCIMTYSFNRKDDESDEKAGSTGEVQRTETLAEAGYLVNLDAYDAGDIVSAELLDLNHLDAYFTCADLTDEQKDFMTGRSYVENDIISLEELSYVKVLHYNFNQQIQVGEIVVNKTIAEDTRSVFKDLFEAKYEIASMYMIDNYFETPAENTGLVSARDETNSANDTADRDETNSANDTVARDETNSVNDTADAASVSADNTSGFCYRTSAAGDGSFSNHAYGLAIDINPQDNPYVLEGQTPGDEDNAHRIKKGDTCYQIFTSHGFSWGGEWEGNVDLQHFEKTAN